MSLLTIVQDAMALCGFDQPSTVYSNTDSTVKFFRTLAQVEGDTLSRFSEWRGLKTSATFTGDGSQEQFALPADFHRFMTAYPLWIDGSPSSALLKANDDEMLSMRVAVATSTLPVWRMKGEYVEFYPAPDDGVTIKYEYQSKYWIDGTERWSSDDNICVIPERLIVLGIVWRFKAARGFVYDEDFRTYQIERSKEIMHDGGRVTIVARSNFPSDYGRDLSMAEPRVIP